MPFRVSDSGFPLKATLNAACPGGSSTPPTAAPRSENKVVASKWNPTATYSTHSIVASVDTNLGPCGLYLADPTAGPEP